MGAQADGGGGGEAARRVSPSPCRRASSAAQAGRSPTWREGRGGRARLWVRGVGGGRGRGVSVPPRPAPPLSLSQPPPFHPVNLMKVKAINRSADDWSRELSQDLREVHRNLDPALRPFEKAVEAKARPVRRRQAGQRHLCEALPGGPGVPPRVPAQPSLMRCVCALHIAVPLTSAIRAVRRHPSVLARGRGRKGGAPRMRECVCVCVRPDPLAPLHLPTLSLSQPRVHSPPRHAPRTHTHKGGACALISQPL